MSGFSRPPVDAENMVSLKVDNLPYRTRPDDLKSLFSKFGEVGDVYIPRDRFTRESRGFAFVRFYEKRDAEDAMDELHGATFENRELRVQKAKYGRPSRPSSYRGGYRDRRGGDRGSGGGRYNRRSRSRSPRRRKSYSRSRSRSQNRSNSRDRSPPRRRSPSRSKSRTPPKKSSSNRSPSRSKSRSPVKNRSPSPPARSKSRSKSPAE